MAGLSALTATGLQRRGSSRFTTAAVPAARELALVALLYAVWRVARALPLARDEGAIERARQIVELQHDLHLPTELSLQQLVLRHDWLGWFTSYYYAGVHVPALVAFVVWLYVRHREEYPHWRNGLAILTGLCLVIRFVRVAPPRFLTDLGYVDISERYGPSLYGPVGTGVSDQFAAMPSIHVGWAAVVSFGIVAAGTSRWRWVFLLHLVLTILVVSASGHHWWLDGIVAIALLGLSLMIDSVARRWVRRRPIAQGPTVAPGGRSAPTQAAPVPHPVPRATAVGIDGFSGWWTRSTSTLPPSCSAPGRPSSRAADATSSSSAPSRFRPPPPTSPTS
ncbi:MAG: phosphatase PAP2 family protein [Acidimicrobiales bacterium]